MSKLIIQMRLKWDQDIRTILQDIAELNYFLDLFIEVQRIIEGNQKLTTTPSHFWNTNNFAFFGMIIGQTRKQVKESGVSLRCIISSIQKHPEFITREMFVLHRTEFWKNEKNPIPEHIRDKIIEQFRVEAENKFTELCGKGEYIDPKIVEEDLRILKEEFEELTTYADKMLFHRENKILPIEYQTWDRDKLNGYVKKVSDMFEKYYKIITGDTTNVKTDMGEEWKSIFKIPWIS